MKKFGIAFALALVILIQPGQPGGPRAYGDESKQIAESMRRFSQEVMAAYERRDIEALKGFYAKQPDALFFWERKMSYSWKQINSTMDSLVSAVKELKLRTSEFRSGGSGSTGWFAATFHSEKVLPGGKSSFTDGRWTVVVQKIGGRWLIVHEHTSLPLPER